MALKDYLNHIKGIAAIIFIAAMLISIASCKKEEQGLKIEATNRDSIPMMDTHIITALISDSGITRYRIKTKVWKMFERERDPYWYFPEGVFFEQFDSVFVTEASVEADTAWYYTSAKLWELKGNVKVLNRKGERFESEELFWNERAHRVYSDKMIRIESDSSYVYGVGFESDQTMTDYHIRNPHDGGIFVKNDSVSNTSSNDSIVNNE